MARSPSRRNKNGLAEWCTEHGCSVQHEVVMPTAADAAEESRMDLVIRVPGLAQLVHVDVKVADATSREALSKNAANRDGVAAQVLDNRKRSKYPNISVMPFSVEAHGRLGEDAKKLAKIIGPADTKYRSTAIADLYQRVASLLQRTQADAIIAATICQQC